MESIGIKVQKKEIRQFFGFWAHIDMVSCFRKSNVRETLSERAGANEERKTVLFPFNNIVPLINNFSVIFSGIGVFLDVALECFGVWESEII